MFLTIVVVNMRLCGRICSFWSSSLVSSYWRAEIKCRDTCYQEVSIRMQWSFCGDSLVTTLKKEEQFFILWWFKWSNSLFSPLCKMSLSLKFFSCSITLKKWSEINLLTSLLLSVWDTLWLTLWIHFCILQILPLFSVRLWITKSEQHFFSIFPYISSTPWMYCSDQFGD